MAFDSYNETTLDFFPIQTTYSPRGAGLCPLLLLETPCPPQCLGPETIRCCPQCWMLGSRWRPWKTSCGRGGEQRSCEGAWDELSEAWGGKEKQWVSVHREQHSFSWSPTHKTAHLLLCTSQLHHLFMFCCTWQIIHLHLIHIQIRRTEETRRLGGTR